MSQRRSADSIQILSSGLKLACRYEPGASVDYCGVAVLAGSRDDGNDCPGLAHFVEHTIFKGTERRSSWHIINRMERVGGELNAFTTKEETVIYTAAPAGNLMRAMELIGDLIKSSRFPDSELDKEREVVEDEINSYLDIPSDAVYDDFEDILFEGTSLGHNILGNTEALASFNSDICRSYLRRWYTIPNMAVFYCGAASPERVAKVVEKCFADIPDINPRIGKESEIVPNREPFAQVRSIGIHQAHTVMGCKIGGMYSDNRIPVALLTNILGGPGMNSKLNVALREKRGLVYSVEASASLLSDCGIFTVYFGCDPEDTSKCEKLVRQQIDAFAQSAISNKALAQAKKQYLGQLAVASDNRENAAISLGRSALYYGHLTPTSEVIEKVNSVSASQITEAAQSISNLSMLTLM